MVCSPQGGSTNHTLHIIAIAAAAGIHITWQDFSDLSALIPLIARVYPNGTADVNAFHSAGGTSYILGELISNQLLNLDAQTITGDTIANWGITPKMNDGKIKYCPALKTVGDGSILRKVKDPFQANGGLAVLKGNMGEAVIKTSAIKEDKRFIEAPAIVFEDQNDLIAAFKAGDLEKDFIAVVRFQGPKAIGMPELHKLTPSLGILQDKGFKVALVTDGRMSGASGKVPAAIHLSPEAADGGPISQIQTGDIICLDADNSSLEVLTDLSDRPRAIQTHTMQTYGRDMFEPLRHLVGTAGQGASIFPHMQFENK